MRQVTVLLWMVIFGGILHTPAFSATIEIASPLDYQVFQRQDRDHGMVRLAGSVDTTSSDIQFRISGKQGDNLSANWQSLAVDRETRSFDVAVSVPAGGWYRVELRVADGDTVVAQRVIEHVGVGEVFIVAGQSNSANYGEQRQQPTSDLVVSFDGARWAIADDPQRGADGEGGSFIPAFGDAMAKTYGVPIGVACVGVGGTSVREWLPKDTPVAAAPTTGANVVSIGPNAWASSGALFDRLMNRIRHFGPHGFRALLWHQGESDVHQPAGHNITPEQYRQYLANLIETTRREAGWKIPWFVAQASYHTPSDPGSPEFRATQKSLADEGTAFEGPNTDELDAEFREANGQGVHFNALGLRRHGELWAKHVGSWLDRMLSAAADDSPETRREATHDVPAPQ